MRLVPFQQVACSLLHRLGDLHEADSLTEFLPFVKETTLLLPAWMSILVILVILAALIVRQASTVKHG